jgi:hypothetical protein
MPAASVQRAEAMSGVSVIPTSFKGRVTLEWSNAPCVLSNSYQTGVVATSDFVHWQEMDRIPYATWCSVTLTNRPAVEFYRAFNTTGF